MADVKPVGELLRERHLAWKKQNEEERRRRAEQIARPLVEQVLAAIEDVPASERIFYQPEPQIPSNGYVVAEIRRILVEEYGFATAGWSHKGIWVMIDAGEQHSPTPTSSASLIGTRLRERHLAWKKQNDEDRTRKGLETAHVLAYKMIAAAQEVSADTTSFIYKPDIVTPSSTTKNDETWNILIQNTIDNEIWRILVGEHKFAHVWRVDDGYRVTIFKQPWE